ncbi:hypothetical protein JCM10213_005877 [Rhodosporidiobolus nylandii]
MQDKLQLEEPYKMTGHLALRRGSLDGLPVLVKVATSDVGRDRIDREGRFYRDKRESLRGVVQPMVTLVEDNNGPKMLVLDSPPGWTPLESFAHLTDEQANFAHSRVHRNCPQAPRCGELRTARFRLGIDAREAPDPKYLAACEESQDRSKRRSVEVLRSYGATVKDYVKPVRSFPLPPRSLWHDIDFDLEQEPVPQPPSIWRYRYVERG